jgi:hypothetical protein
VKGTRNCERRDWTTMTPSDWMEMSPSDWLSMTPSDWVNRAMPVLNRSYADWMNTMASGWLGMMYRPGVSRDAWSPTREREQHRHGAGCECEDCYDYRQKPHHHPHGRHHRCGSDTCECYCCIGDVDLAVYSHLGEQRVIPLVIENDRHREAQISLELSPWTTSGGSPAPVETLLLEPKTFTVPACGEQKVTLVVKIQDIKKGEDQTGGDLPANQATSTEGIQEQRQLPDVDNCLVATSDLRLVGCDHRPLRIAVAILSHNCDPYRVSCGCSCC